MLNGFCNISHYKNEIPSNAITCKGTCNGKMVKVYHICGKCTPLVAKIQVLTDLLLSYDLNTLFVKIKIKKNLILLPVR